LVDKNSPRAKMAEIREAPLCENYPRAIQVAESYLLIIL